MQTVRIARRWIPCSRNLALAFALAAAVAGGCARSSGSARGYNLLLVTLDTVRADHLGAYGAQRVATANLDRLAAEGARFATAESAVPLTLPSHATLLTGLLPQHHGLRLNGGGALPADAPTLASRAAAAGYRTGAFVGSFVLDHRFGLARGFERYDDDIPRPQISTALEAERPAAAVVDRALAWLTAKDTRPFFAWVHLYDAHAPYEPPEPFRSEFRDRPYDGEIASVDAAVGRLLAWLAAAGVAERTIVAVAADHGEALGDHGELTHGLLLYEPTLRVPVLVRAPRVVRAGRVIAAPVGLVDLAPTLAGLLELPPSSGAPTAHLDGRDLSAALRGGEEPATADLYAESRYAAQFGWASLTAIRRGGLKYIAAPRAELYDLDADAGESSNLLPSRPTDGATLASALTALAPDAGRLVAPAPLDAETRARLASLGYLAGAAPPQAPGAPRDPKDTVRLFRAFEEAHWAMTAGRAGEARTGLERLVATDPENPVFLAQLAEACRHQGDRARAVELLRAAAALAPQDREVRYNLAMTLQEAGRAPEALAALRAAVTLDPERPETQNALGIALALAGDHDGARRAFARATELDPHDARAFNNLGNALRELGRFDDAVAAYERATALAPDYADPLNGLGTLAVQRNRPRDAIAYFDRALAVAPEEHEVRLNRAIALELAGERARAAAAYEDFLSRIASDPSFAKQRETARHLLDRLERGARAS